MPTEKTLVCRRCKVTPKLIKEEGRSDTVRCPICSAFDDLRSGSGNLNRGISGIAA